MKRKFIGLGLLCMGAATFFTACSSSSKKNGKGYHESQVTGWPLNDKRYGGFEVANYPGQQTPIGMVFVQAPSEL